MLFRSLAEGDLSGVAANEIQPGLRRQVSGSHVIWFRVEADLLRVVRVLHQSRDATEFFLGGLLQIYYKNDFNASSIIFPNL